MVSNWQPMRRDVFFVLAVTYSMLVVYGLVAEFTGILTVFISYGPIWGQTWPILLFCSAAFALAGMLRTVHTKKYGLEYLTTALLISLLISYSIGIVIRGFVGESPFDRIPYALFPLIISIAPYARLLAILPRRKG